MSVQIQNLLADSCKQMITVASILKNVAAKAMQEAAIVTGRTTISKPCPGLFFFFFQFAVLEGFQIFLECLNWCRCFLYM